MRSTSEFRIANDYTYRQAQQIGETYLKDKFLVVTAVSKLLTSNLSKNSGVPSKGGKKKTKSNNHVERLFQFGGKFARNRNRANSKDSFYTIDLDGPLWGLSTHVGGVGNIFFENSKIRGIPYKGELWDPKKRKPVEVPTEEVEHRKWLPHRVKVKQRKAKLKKGKKNG